MKYLIVTDTHIGANNSNHTILDTHKTMWQELFNLAKEHKIKHIIHAGDFFDSRNSISVKALKHIQDDFIPLIKENKSIQFHIILGNHDILYRNRLDYNSVEPILDNLPNVHIYKEFTNLNDEILLCNWITPDDETNAISQIENSALPYCIGHFEILGFDVSDGITATHGINPSIFAKFKRVLSGHYHRKSNKGNIHYLGTPVSLSFGEYNTMHGFHILDTKKDTLTFLPFTQGYLHHEIRYDIETDTYQIPTNVSLNDLTNKFVRLKYNGKETVALTKLINTLYDDINVAFLRLINDLQVETEQDLLIINSEQDFNTAITALTDLSHNLEHLINHSLHTIINKDIDKNTLCYMKELLSNAHEQLNVDI